MPILLNNAENHSIHIANYHFIRKFFPKGSSVDQYSREDIKKRNNTLLNTPIKSLDGFTPEDAFIAVYGEDLYNKIFK